MVEETAEVAEWYKSLPEWSARLALEFMEWVHNYKDEVPDIKIEDAISAFRAVKDVMASVEIAYERYNFGWTDPSGFFGSGKRVK